MKKQEIRRIAYVALAVLGGLFALWVLSHIFRSGEPNAELARTVREAMELAREAQHEAEAARRASSALRVIALAVGVTAPFIAVYLIYRLRERSEPGVGEVLEVLEKEKLIDLPPAGFKRLPCGAWLQLKESGQGDQDPGGKRRN